MVYVLGTILHPIRKIISTNEGAAFEGCIKIGIMNFGDIISITSEGKILQLEHELGK